MLAFDSNLKPIVGQQVTLTTTNAAAAGPRINLMIAQATAGACELTVKGVLAGLQRGWLRTGGGSFQSDRGGEPTLTDAQLRAHATVAGQERTYHCVPPGSGVRVGIDRDEDGRLMASGPGVWDGPWRGSPTIGACLARFPAHQSPRDVAGAPITGDLFKCARDAVETAIANGTYRPIDMHPYRSALERVFPDGVCDYSQGDVGRPDELKASASR